MPSNITVKKHRVVDKELQDAIDIFFAERDWKGLFLTGGTCLAEFYFGHRLSVDIDLFTPDPDIFLAARRVLLRSDLFPFGTLEPRRSFPDFSEFLLTRRGKDPIKIDLVKDIPVTLGEKIRCDNVWLDSLKDLTANKLGCILNRNEVKDYLDLFYLLPAMDLEISEMIELGRQKDGGLEGLILAHQMQFIQTVPQAPPIFLANVPWKQIQGFFATLHDQILDSLGSLK